MLTANEFYRQRFGCKVYKLSLDGGFTCPNRDGTGAQAAAGSAPAPAAESSRPQGRTSRPS